MCLMDYLYVSIFTRGQADISILVMCDASDIKVYDRRTRDLSNAPFHMKQETTSIEK